MFLYSTPEKEGIPSSAINELIRKLAEQQIPMHSLLIARHGKIVEEVYYAPYTEQSLHRMFSVTKSFTSLAIGLLIDDGRISLEDKICDYFPEYLPKSLPEWLEKMTIDQMLRMETCYNGTTYDKFSTEKNWVQSFFRTEPTHAPGTVFQYDTSSAHTLCALVEKLTGQKMLDFLKDRVLRKIGFSEESYVIPDPFGTSMGGSGLMAKPRDLMNTALLLMNGGKDPQEYHNEKGQQLYPADYLQRALSVQTSTELNGSFLYGYGYQFWMLPHGGYAMYGMGNQDVFCFPQEDVVVICTADTQEVPRMNRIILEDVMETLLKHLFESEAAGETIQMRCSEMRYEKYTLPILETGENTSLQEDIDGAIYELEENEQGFSRIGFCFESEDKGWFEYQYSGEKQSGEQMKKIPFGFGHLEECQFPVYEQHSAVSASWCDQRTLYIRIWLIDEMTASVHLKIAFSNQGKNITVLMKKTEETQFCEFQGILNGRKEG